MTLLKGLFNIFLKWVLVYTALNYSWSFVWSLFTFCTDYCGVVVSQVVESCKINIRKPDPRAFMVTLEKLDVRPEEVIFLDDLGMNLKVAKELGLRTIKVIQPDPLNKRRAQKYKHQKGHANVRVW